MKQTNKFLHKVLAAVLTIAALMTGQSAWATEKTVTYTFTAVNGSGDAKTLTFTPSGNQFGTNPGAKTVTIPNTSNTTGFTVELDDGVILTFSRNLGYMTFSSGGEIILNYSENNNSRFTVACTDYYIRHVKFADKGGNAFYGIGTPAPTSNALLDVDVNIDKASNNDLSKCYQVNSVSGSPTFGSITITLADFASGNGTKNNPYTIKYTSDLDHLATFVNNGQDYSGVYFVLSNDIAYSHSSDWNYADSENNYTAIGTYEHPFKGTFDGQGYTVSGIRIYKKYTTSNHYMDYGLFGMVGEGGTVKRVNLADTHITGYCDVGGIAGRAEKSTIEDCSVGNNVWIHAQQDEANSQGGIVGYSMDGTTVRRCISRATLAIKSGLTGCHYFGGIVGNNNNTITDCIAIGVIIPNVNGRGAIAGHNYDDNDLTSNYYRDCKVASNNVTPTGVGVGKSKYNTDTYDVSNKQGALALYAITLPAHASLVRTASATLPGTNNATYPNGADIAGVPYASASSAVTLSYDATALTPGYDIVITATQTFSGDPVTVTDNGDHTYSIASMPAADITVTATEVPFITYIDANGNEQRSLNPTAIVSSDDAQTLGTATATNWYYVSGNVSTKPLSFQDGTTNIILCDNATLTISESSSTDAIHSSGLINIFAQSGGTGVINIPECKHGIYASNDVNINGGKITISSASSSGIWAGSGDLTIRRGRVDVSSTQQNIGARKNVNILGGVVSASGITATTGYIKLGYSTVEDRITASSYSTSYQPILVADGQALTDGTNYYSGTLTSAQTTALAGQTLSPLTAVSLADNASNATAIQTLNGAANLSVTLQGRTLYKDGDWNTLCLPFDVTDGDTNDGLTFSGTPLEGATVMELNSSTSNLDGKGQLTLNFTNAASIEAGKPYIVRWGTRDSNPGGTILNPVFTGVNIINSGPAPVKFSFVGNSADCQFVGNYAPLEITEATNRNNIVVLTSGSRLGYTTSDRTIAKGNALGAFRAYFYIPANGGSTSASSFELNFEDEETTSLSEELRVKSEEFLSGESVARNATATDWYTLDGRKLQGKPTQKGIYIYKGKKVKR